VRVTMMTTGSLDVSNGLCEEGRRVSRRMRVTMMMTLVESVEYRV